MYNCICRNCGIHYRIIKLRGKSKKMQNVKVYYMPDSNDAFVKENDVDVIIKELNLYIEQLEAENMRLKNSIKALRNNNR